MYDTICMIILSCSVQGALRKLLESGFITFEEGSYKVSDKFFSDEEISRLSVVAPNVVLNIIRNYEVVEKKTVETPDELRGIVKCNNPKCITNNEPMQTVFHVIDKQQGTIRCHYCDMEQDISKVEIL